MNNRLIAGGLGALVLVSTACGGERTRTPDQWRSDLSDAFAARSGDFKACYEKAGGQAKTSVSLRILAGKKVGPTGGSNPLSVQSAVGAGAPAGLVECVKQVVGGIELTPGDTKQAAGVWTVTFDPDADPAVAPAAPNP